MALGTRSYKKTYMICIILAFLSLLLSLTLSDFLYPQNSLGPDLIWQLRLPRVWSAFVAGGLLALSGGLIQAILKNPIADPYLLGVSGGASVGILICLLLGLDSAWIITGSWMGALVSMGLTFLLLRGQFQNSSRLLLTGITLAFGFSALIGLILSLAPPQILPHFMFWMMGDLKDNYYPFYETGILSIGLALALFLSPALNIFSLGPFHAESLGLHYKKLLCVLYILSSLLTACAVTIAGCIGFIGLITPQLVRILLGSDHRYLLPLSVILGGCLLSWADLLARTLFYPQMIPVGVLTSLIGLPIFLFLLQKRSLYAQY